MFKPPDNPALVAFDVNPKFGRPLIDCRPSMAEVRTNCPVWIAPGAGLVPFTVVNRFAMEGLGALEGTMSSSKMVASSNLMPDQLMFWSSRVS